MKKLKLENLSANAISKADAKKIKGGGYTVCGSTVCGNYNHCCYGQCYNYNFC